MRHPQAPGRQQNAAPLVRGAASVAGTTGSKRRYRQPLKVEPTRQIGWDGRSAGTDTAYAIDQSPDGLAEVNGPG